MIADNANPALTAGNTFIISINSEFQATITVPASPNDNAAGVSIAYNPLLGFAKNLEIHLTFNSNIEIFKNRKVTGLISGSFDLLLGPAAKLAKGALPTELGDENLRSFVKSGYNHMSINPDYEAMRTLNRDGFIKMGFPYYGWLIAIMTAPIRAAQAFGIDLIFYGEDGEVEYGGSSETARNPIYDFEYQRRIYLEGGYQKVINNSNLTKEQLFFFNYPSGQVPKIELTHWSYFENWDPYRNYLIAKENCGLKEADSSNSGTFTNFSQNDQKLYALHTYMMYLKFGFGRANQDACIEVRRGAMDREQAINLVKLYDGHYPQEYIGDYLQYYDLSMSEFDAVLDSYANQDLFQKVDGYWKPLFVIK